MRVPTQLLWQGGEEGGTEIKPLGGRGQERPGRRPRAQPTDGWTDRPTERTAARGSSVGGGTRV